MDGFFGYNQIKIALEDQEKIAFTCAWGNFCWNVMPYGLKNAGATYQRVVTTIFHDMMHKTMEDYVDDTLVKSANATLIFKIYPGLHGEVQSET